MTPEPARAKDTRADRFVFAETALHPIFSAKYPSILIRLPHQPYF